MAKAPLRALLPLPTGAERMTIEADGTLVYNTGACRAVLRVDLVNLDSLAPEDQEYVCGLHNRLCTTLAANQTLQMVVESDPMQPEGVIGMMRRFITTEHPALRDLIPHTEEGIRTEMARTHVPDKRAYLIVAPAPEQALGLAGVSQGVKEAIGLETKGAQEPDRYGLDTAVEDVVSLCTAMGLRAQRLRGGEVVSLLWRCANPGVPEPMGLLTAEDLAGALAPTDWEEGFREVRVGEVYTRSLYLLEPPDITNPGWLDDLVSLDATVRLSWHVRGRDREAERIRQLKRRQRLLSVAATRRLGDPETEDAGAEAEALAEGLLDASVSVVWSTLVVTLQAPDRAALDRAASRARRILRTRFAAPFGAGRGYQRALWRASLPFGVDVSRRARRWHSYSVANGLPFLAHSPGMNRGFPIGFTTRGRELVAVNLSDKSLPTWVAVITGRQGSGKTFLTQLLTLHTLYEDGRAAIIDRAGHYRTLIDLVGGTYLALGKEGQPPTINLWDLRPGETLAQKIEMVHAAHEIMLCNPGEKLDKRVEAALERAIRRVYDRYQAQCAAGERAPDAYPLERELIETLDEMSRGDGLTDAERDVYRSIRDSLHSYAGEGRYARLVDRPTTVDLDARLLCFDFDAVDESLHPLLMFIIGYAMGHRAVNTYERTGGRRPELLVIDEGWYLAKYAGAGKWLEDKARRSRHIALRFVFTTQQLSDMIKHPTAVAIFNAASMKCLFRQHDAQADDGTSVIDWLASRLQISTGEARQLTQLGNGQMMFVREGKDGGYRRGLVDVKAGPYEYWLFTSEPDHDVPAKLAAITAAGGDILGALRRLVASHGAWKE